MVGWVWPVRNHASMELRYHLTVVTVSVTPATVGKAATASALGMGIAMMKERSVYVMRHGVAASVNCLVVLGRLRTAVGMDPAMQLHKPASACQASLWYRALQFDTAFGGGKIASKEIFVLIICHKQGGQDTTAASQSARMTVHTMVYAMPQVA